MIQKPFRGVQLNRTHPLAKGLVGCWLFNEATGETAFDMSGHGNNGTLKNGVAWSNGGLEFDGINDFVRLPPTATVAGQTQVTISVWINPGTNDDNNRIYDEQTSASVYTRISLECDTNVIQMKWRDSANDPSGTVGTLTSTKNLNEGQWYHIVGVYDSINNIQKIYIDGVEDASANNSVFALGTSVSNAITIGNQYTQNWFNGSIDSVRIYNRALSAEEITWLHREPYAMFEPAFNPALLYSAAPPVGAIMNQFQGVNVGADLYNGAIIA